MNQPKGTAPNPQKIRYIPAIEVMRANAAGSYWPARDAFIKPTEVELTTLQTARKKEKRENRFKRNHHGDIDVYRANLKAA